MNTKKAVILVAALVVLGGVLWVAIVSLPRPPKNAAKLIQPILYDRIRADDAHYSAGSPNWDLEDRLERLATDKSPAADAASIILLDYYLGEHNGETQVCAVTSRGAKVLPLLEYYRQHRAGLLRPWYVTLRLNREERESMYETVLSAIKDNKVLGCD